MNKSDQDTVVTAIGDQEERVLRDRVELAPSPMDLVPATGFGQALQFLDRTDATEEREVIEEGDNPQVHAPLREDPEEFVNELPSAGTPRDPRESRDSVEEEESENLQKGERIVSERAEGNGDQDCVIDKIVDHGY